MERVSAGNIYTGSELIAYASRHPSVLYFYENSSSGIKTDDASSYDVVAVEHGFLQMQGGVNKVGELITIRLLY